MTVDTGTAPGITGALRRLYYIRFAFALIWAVLLIASGGSPGLLLTVWLFLYPLFDAGAVLYQLRADRTSSAPRVPEWINVALSVAAAIALAIVSSSVAAVLIAWGAWAIVSGLLQLVVAIARRRAGGQVALMISGAVSILAGGAFAAMGAVGGSSLVAIGGYAIVGAVLFLLSAVRLSVLKGRES